MPDQIVLCVFNAPTPGYLRIGILACHHGRHKRIYSPAAMPAVRTRRPWCCGNWHAGCTPYPLGWCWICSTTKGRRRFMIHRLLPITALLTVLLLCLPRISPADPERAPLLVEQPPEYRFSDGFSDKQGANNWYYKEWDGSSYADLRWDEAIRRWRGSGKYCQVWKGRAHPDTTDAVIAWKALGRVTLPFRVSSSGLAPKATARGPHFSQRQADLAIRVLAGGLSVLHGAARRRHTCEGGRLDLLPSEPLGEPRQRRNPMGPDDPLRHPPRFRLRRGAARHGQGRPPARGY